PVADAPRSPGRAAPAGPAPLDLPCAFGDFELLEEIARGGMGVVYKARQVSLDRTVALKMILKGEEISAEAVERFRREAQAAALDHPNSVTVHDVGEHGGHHFLAMAYVEGASLEEVVSRQGPPPPREVAALLADVAEAVAFAHEHGVIHRDLKPE